MLIGLMGKSGSGKSLVSMLFKEINVIDLRAYKKRNIKELICNEDYDKIVCIYNTGVEDMFIFD